MMQTDDNMDYYTYMLIYVDDCLMISENMNKELVHYFKMRKAQSERS